MFVKYLLYSLELLFKTPNLRNHIFSNNNKQNKTKQNPEAITR